MKWHGVLGHGNAIIYVPENGFFSLGNSPYRMHGEGNAADIYLGYRDFANPIAFSPVRGKVIFLKPVRTPKRYFSPSNNDYVLGILNENKGHVFRILHVQPSVKVGDTVDIGDEIGMLIRSGFFCRWTDPHIHIEVRKTNSRLDVAQGGLKLNLITNNQFKTHNNKKINIDHQDTIVIDGAVKYIRDEYFLIALDNEYICKNGILFGFKSEIATNGEVRREGILDAGVPYYPHGCIIGISSENASAGDHIVIGNLPVGTIRKINNYYAIFKTKLIVSKLSIEENGKRTNYKIKGISASIHLKRENFSLKIVYDSLEKKPNLQKGMHVTIKLNQIMNNK